MAPGIRDEPETTNLGLSPEGHSVLKRLKDSGAVGEMSDAYRLGAALAIRLRVQPPVLSDRTTVFGVATIDPEGKFRAAVEELYEEREISPYRVLERLADWGVRELERRLVGDVLEIDDVVDGPADG